MKAKETQSARYQRLCREAQRLANQSGMPYLVFRPYMPSVHNVATTPHRLERMPVWNKGREKEWARQQESQGGRVFWPKV